MVVGKGRAASPADYVISSRQLYASHYFDASLGLTVLARDESGSVLAYLNRSRVDAFGGGGGITRRIVRSRARGALIDSFAELRDRLQRSRQATITASFAR